jgi:hypothetical protein
MGMNTAFVTRVDDGRAHPLIVFDPPNQAADDRDTGRPRLPITEIVEEKGGLLVFSFSDVFRVDKSLETWKKTATLKIGYRWGRPDAVGAYPSVCSMHLPRNEGEPYLLATTANGYVAFDGAKTTRHQLSGQLGASGVYHVENSSEGPLFFEADDRLSSWRLGSKGWEIARIDPPLEPDPAGEFRDFERQQGQWYETRVLVSPGGAIYTVSSVSGSPGTRTTARRVDGKSEVLGRETSTLNPSATFLTADGTLWNANFGELKQFENGRWATVGRLPGEQGLWEPAAVDAKDPPWLVIDRFHHALSRLETAALGSAPRLTQIDIKENGRPLRIDDAIAWSDGAVLLATDAGLRAYSASAHKLAPVGVPDPPSPAKSLARDGRGRLWLGGDGLWLSHPGENTLESFDRVPWVGRNQVFDLVPDPEHDDGIIAALGPRGVALVRAGNKP